MKFRITEKQLLEIFRENRELKLLIFKKASFEKNHDAANKSNQYTISDHEWLDIGYECALLVLVT